MNRINNFKLKKIIELRNVLKLILSYLIKNNLDSFLNKNIK